MKKVLFYFFFLAGQILTVNAFAQKTETLRTEDVLDMTLSDLLNIQVVTASKIQQPVNEVPATVFIVTEEQIRNRGYFTLEEALSDLPGFQFRNINGFNSYIFMRGVPSQNNLILLMIDGVQINELNSGGFYAGGQFIMSDIKQIEVVYGPASALYGTNAVSGIINIITKRPDQKHSHISIQGGNFNTGMIDFNVKNNPSENIGYSFSGQYKTSEKANLKGARGDFNWTNDMENFENDLSFSARLKIKKLDAGVDYQEKRASMTTNFKSVDDIYLDKNSLWDIYFLNAYLKYLNEFHKNWSFKSTGYFRDATVKSNTINAIVKASDSDPGMQIGYYRPNQLAGIENQLNFSPSEKLLIIAGLIGETEWLSEGFSETYSNSQAESPAVPSKPKILNNNLFSYYSHIKYSLIKELSFSGGIRHDFSSYYGQVFIPRVGLIFQKNNFIAKVLYNTAFRSPRPWDYTYGTGNENLEPEKMKSWELSVSYKINEKINISGAVYYNMISNKLTKQTNQEFDRWINENEVNTAGFELNADYIANNLTFYINYTFNDSYDQHENLIPEISRHCANTGATYSLSKNMNLNLRANYLGDRNNPTIIPATGDDKIDDALVFHGCLTYSGINNFTFQLKANNILNTEYYHPSNRFEGRYRQPQRIVSLKATYNFGLKNN
ncbi:MAG: TonB-dependent receptor [Prolixibacteraceae bacterium]|nr:TonB-dependent receptor [Prolixibacteraceae bacterium]